MCSIRVIHSQSELCAMFMNTFFDDIFTSKYSLLFWNIYPWSFIITIPKSRTRSIIIIHVNVAIIILLWQAPFHVYLFTYLCIYITLQRKFHFDLLALVMTIKYIQAERYLYAEMRNRMWLSYTRLFVFNAFNNMKMRWNNN